MAGHGQPHSLSRRRDILRKRKAGMERSFPKPRQLRLYDYCKSETGREEAIREHGKIIEEAVKADPPEDWKTNPQSFVKFVRDHHFPSFLEYGEYPYVSGDEIKKALKLKAAFSEMLDQMP